MTKRFWFMVASDTAASFRWEHILRNQSAEFWWIRRLPRNFKAAREEDMILCYRSGSERRGLVGIAEVDEAMTDDGISVRGVRAFNEMIPYHEFKHEAAYKSTEAGRLRNRGTLFAVNEEFTTWVAAYLTARGDWESADFLSAILHEKRPK
ncbi:MAG TPA: EVE domain-containing protein [Bacillales bacterium]|nr:EVE domain-containing protein [Bacillales bacterium]